jgi:hypothetical protein
MTAIVNTDDGICVADINNKKHIINSFIDELFFEMTKPPKRNHQASWMGV